MQYVFLMGGWDGVSCNNDIAVYSPDGAPSGHMAPGARRMLSPRDALAAVGEDALTNATRRAAEAAAINCRRSGCNPPWRDELTNL